ncbi:MAG: AP-3 complex subunit mu [Vezdaea aestivalis]|nr:MAG: AP-3 complex subunit mu [Vezdaea aestivalis]
MSGAIEAVYIFSENSLTILHHTYRGRPLSASDAIRLYREQPTPQPSLIYLANTSPPTLLFSLVQSNLIFLASSSREIEPLLVLEFLHRFYDVLEEYLGAPLLAGKIEANYDVVAQLLGEMCDAGIVNCTEPNILRDAVEMPGWMGKFFGNVSLPGTAPGAGGPIQLVQTPTLNPQSSGSALPWRRANVRHTSNEMYVDVIEKLSVIMAPSGRPLSAFANGTLVFTSKLSGVPDLLLVISAPGGKAGIERALELPMFHPCVRLSRWKERPGELSFVPPDGKFVLASYEVDLLPSYVDDSSTSSNLQLPVSLDVRKSLGPDGAEFDVRLQISTTLPGTATPPASNASRMGFGSRTGTASPALGAVASSAPLIESIVVTIPLPRAVQKVAEIKANRGEATYSTDQSSIEWRVPTKTTGPNRPVKSATLRCTVVGEAVDDGDEAVPEVGTSTNEYVEDTYQSQPIDVPGKSSGSRTPEEDRDEKRARQNALLMPSSAMVSFSVKRWLASGIKVDSININMKQSKGLSETVKPYKGVKYQTVSQNGVEVRC